MDIKSDVGCNAWTVLPAVPQEMFSDVLRINGNPSFYGINKEYLLFNRGQYLAFYDITNQTFSISSTTVPNWKLSDRNFPPYMYFVNVSKYYQNTELTHQEHTKNNVYTFILFMGGTSDIKGLYLLKLTVTIDDNNNGSQTDKFGIKWQDIKQLYFDKDEYIYLNGMCAFHNNVDTHLVYFFQCPIAMVLDLKNHVSHRVTQDKQWSDYSGGLVAVGCKQFIKIRYDHVKNKSKNKDDGDDDSSVETPHYFLTETMSITQNSDFDVNHHCDESYKNIKETDTKKIGNSEKGDSNMTDANSDVGGNEENECRKSEKYCMNVNLYDGFDKDVFGKYIQGELNIKRFAYGNYIIFVGGYFSDDSFVIYDTIDDKWYYLQDKLLEYATDLMAKNTNERYLKDKSFYSKTHRVDRCMVYDHIIYLIYYKKYLYSLDCRILLDKLQLFYYDVSNKSKILAIVRNMFRKTKINVGIGIRDLSLIVMKYICNQWYASQSTF